MSKETKVKAKNLNDEHIGARYLGDSRLLVPFRPSSYDLRIKDISIGKILVTVTLESPLQDDLIFTLDRSESVYLDMSKPVDLDETELSILKDWYQWSNAKQFKTHHRLAKKLGIEDED